MAQKTIAIADKPTLDTVNEKCDAIIDAVQSGGGSSANINLDKIHVFILDTTHDEIIMQYGAADRYGHRLQT